MPAVSDGSRIVGNEGLQAAARRARVADIHEPYHAAIGALLDARRAAHREAILLSLHSFTPDINGIARPWDIGMLYWRGRTDFAIAMLRALREQGKEIIVGDNVPYAMDDTDYTVPHHAFPRELPYAEIEVRQDLITTAHDQAIWAARIANGCRATASA
jgi:predicted N-formylglutamate amidohydrolase